MGAPKLLADFATVLPVLAQAWQPSLPPLGEDDSAARLLLVNEELADELGIDPDWIRSPEGVAALGAREAIPGSTPVTQAYAGHQFGGFSPLLGDGRAVLLGELRTASGDLRDIALKGSGRTPFSRGGDGRAVLGPVLREYLLGEAMHALGIPTTRALAVVLTGDRVHRDGVMQPGAVLTRVAASHLRVGTFEVAAITLREDLRRPTLEALTGYAIARHHPGVAGALGLLEAVVEAQARLIAQWQAVGFVHGVMNTDNTTISGETIDYGPCAWLEAHDTEAVFSSIDTGGRYRFGMQPPIMQWNLSRLAETLLPLVDDDPNAALEAVTQALQGFRPRFEERLLDAMRVKLALPDARPDDADLVADLLEVMQREQLDHTLTFRALGSGASPALAPWLSRWRSRLGGRDPREVERRLAASNPLYVPRNHLVDAALGAAQAGDLVPFTRLLDAVRHPYTQRPGDDDLAEPAPEGFTAGFVTYCGT